MKIRKFREDQVTQVNIPDFISDEDLSTTIDVLLSIGDVRVTAWIIENINALKLTDGQIEVLCGKRPLTIKMRQVLARRIKTTAAAHKLKAGCTSLNFRIELLKNQHLSDDCKKSCLTKSNLRALLSCRDRDPFNLDRLRGKVSNQIWQWLDAQRAVKDIIT